MKIINEGKKLTEGSVSTDLSVQAYASDINQVIRMIREAQVAEIDATNMYEKIADAVASLAKYNENQEVTARIPELDKIASTMRDIANEEKVHSGELQKLLSLLDKDEDSFYLQGRQEVGDI
jgi:rubrerythrin